MITTDQIDLLRTNVQTLRAAPANQTPHELAAISLADEILTLLEATAKDLLSSRAEVKRLNAVESAPEEIVSEEPVDPGEGS